MKYLLAILALLLVGCWGSPIPRIGPGIPSNGAIFGVPEVPPLKKGETATDQAYTQIAFWTAQLDAEKAKGKRDKDEERQRWLERICRAVIVICFVGILANVALFILSFKFDWFGGMRRAAVVGVVANIVIISLVWFIPGYIGYVAGLVVLGTAATALILIKNMHGIGCEVQGAKNAITAVVKKL